MVDDRPSLGGDVCAFLDPRLGRPSGHAALEKNDHGFFESCDAVAKHFHLEDMGDEPEIVITREELETIRRMALAGYRF
jgi:hypothetical protein